MTAYAIGQLTITNKDWMEEYTSKIGRVISKHGGVVITKGQPEQLEGKSNVPQVSIVIEFPNKTDAKSWYNDPDNQELVKLRNTGSSFELLLVESP